MMFLTIMVLLQLAVLAFALVTMIRDRWHWLLAAPFLIVEAAFLYYWAAPFFGQHLLSISSLLFWVASVSSVTCGMLLNWFLPPLPARLARICHPQGLILVYLLVSFSMVPFVLFGLVIGDVFVTNGYIDNSQYAAAMMQIFLSWLGVTLLFAYLYRATRRSGQTFPDMWEMVVGGREDDEPLDSERDRPVPRR